VATVEPYEGGRVPVLVREITPADEAALDRHEGWPCVYRKETVVEILRQATSASAEAGNVDLEGVTGL
jgi:hypothetical protein